MQKISKDLYALDVIDRPSRAQMGANHFFYGTHLRNIRMCRT